ncbi:MAG: hypothetical protein LIP02_04040 [Bacteroidales bacterium]|nr:hypothetical protein [Bacteroidales bacterium]
MARRKNTALQKRINRMTGTNTNLTRDPQGRASQNGRTANAQMQTLTDPTTGKVGRSGRQASRSQRLYDIKKGIRDREIQDYMDNWRNSPESQDGMTEREARAAAGAAALSVG